MKIRSISRLNVDPKKGSGTIYLKKEFVEKLGIHQKVDLFAEYDDETGKLCIQELDTV